MSVDKFLRELFNKLDDNDISYMISGSIASNFYCIPRMTRDVDIVIELSERKVVDFVELFPESYINIDTVKEEVGRKGMFNVIDHKTGFKVDFIVRKDNEYSDLAFSRKERIKGFDTEIWVININDLLIAKIMWIQDYQSERQISDIKNLLDNPLKDMKYVKKWCESLKLETFGLLDNE
jgi:hypothetical protein